MIFEPEFWCRWSTWAIRRMKSLKRPSFWWWFLNSNPFNQGIRFQQEFCRSVPNLFLWIFFNVDFGESQISPWNDELVTGARMFEASNRCVRNFPATWIPQRLDKLILQELYDVKCRFIRNSPFPHGESPGVIKKQIARKSFFNLLILFVNICLVISF